jgi:hypothetical protein
MKSSKSLAWPNVIILVISCIGFPLMVYGQDALKFNKNAKYTESVLTFLDGKTVKYRAYENIFYVSKVVDSAYQSLNFYVPEKAFNDQKKPIFLKTNVGGYMAAKASAPSNVDATGRALLEGYVVVIPGARGWNSKIDKNDGTSVYTGRAPAAIVDLKAAIRYLRYNDATMAGDAERIITDGTSAGGAMSSLLGASGNNPRYEPYLKALGAAVQRDDVFATVAYCPIIDLEHSDIAYEWLYSGTNTKSRSLPEAQADVSNELAALYPKHLNNLALKKPDGTLLTSENYLDYLKSFLITSAQKARDDGMDFAENSGVKLNKGFRGTSGEFVLDIDLETYLDYVVVKQPLKSPPAFDKLGVLAGEASFENNLFGNDWGKPKNFTNFSLNKSAGSSSSSVDAVMQEKVFMLNPMNFVGDGVSTTTKHWYIRHGALDRDTAFNISINFYTKLINKGYEVNFALPWNRQHRGDYDLNDLFAWIDEVVQGPTK